MPRERASHTRRRRICFVPGTRAEFGLMEKTLRAIARHPKLELQIVVTGMHLDRARGCSQKQIEISGFKIARRVSGSSRNNSDPKQTARSTGNAIAKFASTFEELQSDI